MNPGRFFIPRMGMNLGPMMNTNFFPSRGGIGLFGRLSNSLRSFNWSSLLNGANKTLNVVNQTIPLVRQAGPMFNNMKSMLRLAKAFGNETVTQKTNNKLNVSNNTVIDDNINFNNISSDVIDSNSPVFFV